MVVYPHGGPWARDYIDFDPTVQFFASRGYAVFQMNFRGSTGYGAAFETKGHQRLGLEMQDDLTDGVRWLIDQGVADPERIAIYGASYGGYAALMGAATTPELFQCAASYAGLTDIDALMSDLNWYQAEKRNAPYFGEDAEQRRRTSPVNLASSIRVPVLLGHGEDDPTVHFSQSKEMASAFESAGTPVELVLYEDEIHGSRGQDNRVDWNERLAVFLDRCLQN